MVAKIVRLSAKSPSAAYLNGVADGRLARAMGDPIEAYHQVGMDDYARGFRRGFFGDDPIEDSRDKDAG